MRAPAEGFVTASRAGAAPRPVRLATTGVCRAARRSAHPPGRVVPRGPVRAARAHPVAEGRAGAGATPTRGRHGPARLDGRPGLTGRRPPRRARGGPPARRAGGPLQPRPPAGLASRLRSGRAQRASKRTTSALATGVLDRRATWSADMRTLVSG